MRPARIAATLLALAAVASRRGLTQDVDIHLNGDSALGVLPGVTELVPVYTANYASITTGRLTFVFDPTKLTVNGVVSNTYGMTATLVPRSPGVVTVATSGALPYYNDSPAFSLDVQLNGGVTDGTYIWVRPDTMQVSPTDDRAPNYRTTIGRICHATYAYGDLDGNGRVDSRDALVTLSAAVGLPVTGFALSRGDVDRDSVATSRDALMMLSWSIALPVTASSRLGTGVPDGCPGLSPAPATVVFVREPVGGTGYTDTLYTIASGSSTRVPVPDPNATGRVFDPRLAADGQSIVYGCYRQYPTLPYYYDQICTIHGDGTGFQALTPYLSSDAQPDWSPSAARIVWYNGGYLQVNPPVPLGQSQSPQLLLGSGTAPAWSPDSLRIAFAYGGYIHVINSNGTGDVALPPANLYPQRVRWSPASDSLAFLSFNYTIRLTSLSGGASRAMVPIAVSYPATFDWGAPGFVFALPFDASRPGFQGIWFVPHPDGPIQRLTDSPDIQPSFQRVR